MFDCSTFLSRKRLKQRQLAEMLKKDVSTVGCWCSGKNVPSYVMQAELIKLGVTAQEMFGDELGTLLIQNSSPDKPASKREILAAVKEVLSDLSKI